MTDALFDALLDPTPLPVETGWQRRDDGVLHVSCRTDLHGCTGEMFRWWFSSFRPDDQQYRWWHPVDHRASRWLEAAEGTEVGAIHRAVEAVTTFPEMTVWVQFRDPDEVFTPGRLRSARAAGAVSEVVTARVGVGDEPLRDGEGAVMGGRLVHLARDTAWGCALRSHFLFAPDLVMAGFGPEDLAVVFPDELGPAILQHCYNEMTFLSRFLPSLFVAEQRDVRPVALPW